MLIVLLVILVLSVIGLAGYVVLRGPLIRAADARHGLSTAHGAITDARKSRMVEYTRSTELESKVKAQRKKLAEIEAKLKKAEKQIAKLPEQIFQIVFELGAPGPGLQAYEFTVARHMRGPRGGTAEGPEAQLWARPRILRAWSRNETNAITMAQNRFPGADGYMMRAAERRETAALLSDALA